MVLKGNCHYPFNGRPDPSIGHPASVFGGLKARLFEGPLIELEPLGTGNSLACFWGQSKWFFRGDPLATLPTRLMIRRISVSKFATNPVQLLPGRSDESRWLDGTLAAHFGFSRLPWCQPSRKMVYVLIVPATPNSHSAQGIMSTPNENMDAASSKWLF